MVFAAVSWGPGRATSHFALRMASRDEAVGRGRGRVNPSPGTGDKGLVARDLHALRHKASADLLVKLGNFGSTRSEAKGLGGLSLEDVKGLT